MDQTELFKAIVRTLKLRRKKQGAVSSPPHSDLLSNGSQRSSQFARSARDVVMCISKLQTFLLKHRKNYIDSSRHLLGGEGSAMTDSERDKIDSEAQTFLTLSRDRITSLQSHLKGRVLGEQIKEYRRAVYESLQNYLRRVATLYSEQRAIRVKRIVDRKRTSRLQPEGYRKLLGSSRRPNRNASSSLMTIDRDPSPVEPMSMGDDEISDSGEDGEMGGGTQRGVAATAESSSTGVRYRGRGGREGGRTSVGDRVSATAAATTTQSLPVMSTGLTDHEEAEFAQENEQLFEHVSTMADEVRQIEGKVIEISKLQELFSSKVLQQAEQLDSISQMTVESSENVNEGNEQIKGAIKNRASLRVWILFILIVLSFALLFLDWYS